MKNKYCNVSNCMLVISMISFGCSKDASHSLTPPLTPPTVYNNNQPPKANAGLDIWTALPVDTVILSGSYSSSSTEVHQFFWKQVSGPSNSSIKHQDSMRTSVTNLISGIYKFEFTVSNKLSFWDKDTVSVFVKDTTLPEKGEAIFAGQAWSCPMGCYIIINCLTCYVPVTKSFKVLLRESSLLPWIEVVPEAQWTANTKYSYSVDGGKMFLYTNDDPGAKPDIKIVY